MTRIEFANLRANFRFNFRGNFTRTNKEIRTFHWHHFCTIRIKNFKEGSSLVFNMFHQTKLFVVVRFYLQESLNILKIKANYTAFTIWQSVTSMWWQAQWTVGMKNTLTGPRKWNQDKCLIRAALNVSCRENWNMRTIVVLIDISAYSRPTLNP